MRWLELLKFIDGKVWLLQNRDGVAGVVGISIWCGWVVAKSGWWLFPPQTLPISQAFVGTPRTSPTISTSLLLIVMMVIMVVIMITDQNFTRKFKWFQNSKLSVLFSFVIVNRPFACSILYHLFHVWKVHLSLNHKRRSTVIRPGSTPGWGFGLHWAQTVKWRWAEKLPWRRNKDVPRFENYNRAETVWKTKARAINVFRK